jgi:ATP-dependent DNA helicase RecQ
MTTPPTATRPAVPSTDPVSLLGRFGLTTFRPGQRDVVDALADGRDVLCVMPTGGGKSLCYQLPALAREGTTIVVSPLIALMKDQVDALQRLGIPAKLINSTLTASEQDDVMAQMAAGKLKLVYVAPERLRNGRFLEAVGTAGVTLLAIDEAHCVSEWGHDFRPDYARLGRFRKRYLGGVQTIALTATATPYVREDIKGILELAEPREFVTGFARTNLRFTVDPCTSDREKNDKLFEFITRQPGSGIIYAATRKRCEELAEWLPQKLRRPIGVYHAGLDSEQRRQVQEDFMSDKLAAIVATNAFGMGIDKADIRYVVHYNIPGSLEAYYQEAGRAGRDGKPSECRLLFSYSDRYVQEFFIENRYPSPAIVRKVWQYLLAWPDDPIELTLDQIRNAIQIKETSESVGTSETLLARAGVLKRLDSNTNALIIRIDSDLPTIVDMLPREAKTRRKVLLACEKVIGKRRGEDVYVSPQRLAQMAGVEREPLARTLRELSKLRAFDYVPPFRGRAVHITQRDVRFDEIEIDFEELARRKAAEFEKLEAVIEFARTPRCRQRAVLEYFGDPNVRDCRMCDRCDPQGKSMPAASGLAAAALPTAGQLAAKPDDADRLKGIDPEAIRRGIRIVLSGIKRMHGRFGKMMIAQMLGGSQNKKVQQWKLNRLSTYGMLSALKQPELSDLLDAVIAAGMASQVEVDDRRPTVQLTEFGEEVMHARQPIPPSLNLSFPLAKRLARAAAAIEGGDVAGETGRSETGRSEITPARSTATNATTNTNPQGSLTTELDDDASHDDSLEDATDDSTDEDFDSGFDDAIDLDDATEPTYDQQFDAQANDEPHTAPAAKAKPADVGAGKGIASKQDPRVENDGDDDQEKSPLEEELANRLKRWRGKTSAALGIPAYRVLSNATIARLAAERPDSTDRLEQVSGIGPSTMEQFGYDLVELIRQVIADHDGQEGLGKQSPQNTPERRVPMPPPRLDPAVAKSLPGVSPSPASRSAEVTNRPAPATQPAETKKADAKPQDIKPSDIKPNQPSIKTPADAQPRIPAVAPTSAADAYWTWKMLRDGYTWHDVAAIRRATPRQLLDDLITVSQAGHPVNPDWVEDASLRAELQARLTRK